MNEKNSMSREEQLLKSTAQQVKPSPSFTNELEKKLMNAHKPTQVGSFSVRKIVLTAGWTMVFVALALTFIWVIGSIAPRSQPQPAAGNTSVPVGETAEPKSQPTPEGKTYKNSAGQFVMTVDLPEAPPQAALYQLDPTQENEKYKVVKILELAGRVGMNGTLYYLSEKYGGPGLIYTDGKQRIEANNYALHRFSYYPDYITYPLIVNQGNPLSPEEMSAKAEEFLKAHGLLDFPYQVELPTDANSRMVTFEPRLNELPDSSYTFLRFETLQVSFDQNGEIAAVDWNVQPWEAKGSYPLISAQEAWDKFITNENGLGAEMDSGGYSPSLSSPALKLWKRDIPLNQPTSLIGTVDSFDPVNGNTPLFVMDNISLTGNLEGLTNLQEAVQLDGQYIMDGDVKKFQVDSWKTVDSAPTPLEGTLEQADGQSWLVTTDGKRLQMEDLPKDIQFGEKTSVDGIVSGDKLDWRTITQGQGGGGGGGGGGGSGLARLNLSGTPMPTATPWPTSTPVDQSSLVGSRLEGEHGIVDVWNLQADDGSTHFAYKISSNSESGFFNNSFGQANLEGPATEELKAYYHMPVKIWGTITSINSLGVPTIQLERYEALYPGEKIQLWFGEEKAAQVDGKSALLFTTNDGTTYVRDDSIESGEKPITLEKGYVFHIAGWSDPNETLGGYPVIHVMSLGLLPKDYDFNSVITNILTPPIMNESDLNASGEPQTGIINRVELVYLGEDQLVPQVEEGRVLYAQPFWRFSGYYSKTSFFNIIVQALPDKYLQPTSLQ